MASDFLAHEEEDDNGAGALGGGKADNGRANRNKQTLERERVRRDKILERMKKNDGKRREKEDGARAKGDQVGISRRAWPFANGEGGVSRHVLPVPWARQFEEESGAST